MSSKALAVPGAAPDAERVQIIEADELHSYVGQKKEQFGSGGLLIALPETFSAGRWVIRGTRAARALGAQLPQGPAVTLCTDHWQCCNAIFAPAQHIKSKARTCQIESMNNRLRFYLARLRRKTHCYSKSVTNFRDSLLLISELRLAANSNPPRARSNANGFGMGRLNTYLAIVKNMTLRVNSQYLMVLNT